MYATDNVGHALHQPHLIINSRHRPVSTTSYAPDPDLTCTALSNWNVTELRDAPTSRAYLHTSLRAAPDPLHMAPSCGARVDDTDLLWNAQIKEVSHPLQMMPTGVALVDGRDLPWRAQGAIRLDDESFC